MLHHPGQAGDVLVPLVKKPHRFERDGDTVFDIGGFLVGFGLVRDALKGDQGLGANSRARRSPSRRSTVTSFQLFTPLMPVEALERAMLNVSAISSAGGGVGLRCKSAWICAMDQFVPHFAPISPQGRMKSCMAGVRCMV